MREMRDELLKKDDRQIEGPSSVSKTFVVEVLDLCPQRIAGVISYNTQYAHNDDYDDDDYDDDEMMMIIHTTDP